MPIYAYRCDACGHAKDVLQRISDPVLSTCPACGAGAFRKQLTAAGFQLKGTGWYATDFRGSAGAAAKADVGGADAAAKPEDRPQPAGDAPASAPAPGPAAAAPAGGCGASCACH